VSKTTPYRETVGPAKSIEVVNFSSNTVYVAFEGLSSISDNWDMAVPAWLTRVQPYTGSGQLTTVLVGNGVARGSSRSGDCEDSEELEGAMYFQLPQTINVQTAQPTTERIGTNSRSINSSNSPQSWGHGYRPKALYVAGAIVDSPSSPGAGSMGSLQIYLQGTQSGGFVTLGWAAAWQHRGRTSTLGPGRLLAPARYPDHAAQRYDRGPYAHLQDMTMAGRQRSGPISWWLDNKPLKFVDGWGVWGTNSMYVVRIGGTMGGIKRRGGHGHGTHVSGNGVLPADLAELSANRRETLGEPLSPTVALLLRSYYEYGAHTHAKLCQDRGTGVPTDRGGLASLPEKP
jgi:hypothetical protein